MARRRSSWCTATAWVALDVNDRISRQYDRVPRRRRHPPDRGRARAPHRRRQQRPHRALGGGARRLRATTRSKGTGAGTYELTWAKHRSSDFTVRDGHSLYLETLSELGIVGAILLFATLGGILVGLAWHARGRQRALWGALFTGGCVWALHAAQDWVWELPSVTAWLFAAGGIALARPPGAPETRLVAPPRLARVIGALVVLALAVTPVLNALADARLRDSVHGVQARRLPDAPSTTRCRPRPPSGARPEPYAILGFCDVRLGKPELAERMMRNAVDRDPNSWVYHYGLALVLASTGRGPAARRSRSRADSTRASRARSRPTRPSPPPTTPRNGKGGPQGPAFPFSEPSWSLSRSCRRCPSASG